MNETPESIREFIRPRKVNSSVFWQIAEELPPRLNTALIVISIALPFSLWWAITTFGNIDTKFLPSPAQVATAFLRLWSLVVQKTQPSLKMRQW